MALEIVEGDASRQYHLQVDRTATSLHPRFSKFYMCLEGCKKGFVEGCRPFIRVDGCHLKTMYGGIFLCALAKIQMTSIFLQLLLWWRESAWIVGNGSLNCYWMILVLIEDGSSYQTNKRYNL